MADLSRLEEFDITLFHTWKNSNMSDFLGEFHILTRKYGLTTHVELTPKAISDAHAEYSESSSNTKTNRMSST